MHDCRKISALLVIAMLLFLIVACLCSTGCRGLHISIGGDVTPNKKPVDEVKPVPPPPPPPKDDWAPPWFHRRPKHSTQIRPPQGETVFAISVGADRQLQGKILSNSVPNAVLGDASAALVSMTLAATTSSEEAIAAAVASLPEQMQAVHNRIRADRNLSPQALDVSLCRAAQDYANYLAITNQQGHFAKGGPEQRARAAGFTGSLLTPGKPSGGGWTSYGIGEVLAFGHRDIESAFQGWLDSKGHREALRESSYNVCGFGYAVSRNGPVLVGMFGRESTGAE